MSTSLNPNKILRTGDEIIDTTTQERGVIHYVCEKNGQMTFEREVSQLQSVQYDNGSKLIILPIAKVGIYRSK